MPLILLLRHGYSEANEAGLLAGWTPGVSLTERGRSEALDAKTRLDDVTLARIVTSPVQRCRETAEIVRPAGVPLLEDERVGECHYGAWSGRPLVDLAKEPLWRVIQEDPGSATFPEGDLPGESLSSMGERMVRAIAEHDAAVLDEHGPTAAWLLVSHGDPIKFAVADATGAGLAGLQRVRIDPASISAILRTPTSSLLAAANTMDGPLTRFVPAEHAAPAEGVVGGEAD